QNVISVYRCPSDGNRTSKGQWLNIPFYNYVVCMGNAAVMIPNGANDLNDGGHWCIDSTRTPDITLQRSAMFEGSNKFRYDKIKSNARFYNFSAIIDGLSNTAACAETVQGSPDMTKPAVQDFRGGTWWGSASFFTTYLSPNSSDFDTMWCGNGTLLVPKHKVQQTNIGTAAVLASRSFHSGGVNVGYGDGSIHFISDTVNIDAWRNLGAANDGNSLLP
ncbi:MAG: DUF1559 domain-containing protein, partial [Planctomycetaceae bacterium]|nr:DUF1559 domain-containing protein [Planctomycetaceae bacterium]